VLLKVSTEHRSSSANTTVPRGPLWQASIASTSPSLSMYTTTSPASCLCSCLLTAASTALLATPRAMFAYTLSADSLADAMGVTLPGLTLTAATACTTCKSSSSPTY